MSKDKTIFKPFENIYDENFIKLQKERNKMIKYAKTKDGKIVKVSLEGDVFTSRYEIVGELRNTIEELCDGIIVEEKDKPDKWFVMEINEFEEMDEEEKLYQLKNYNFNAFIKTDKGLIYVAKMNDKGKLELL